LAQALIHDPEVLILDEPTTGLDPNQLVEIRRFIKELAVQKTVILSTHIMQEAAAMCDRALIIHNGEIVADIPTHDLQSNLQLQSFEVEFSSTIDINQLQSLPQIKSVEQISGNRFAISSDEDIRELLFKFSVEKGWVILSLNRREQSLEEVFGMLTK
jgi:ABC-2 type transport system ATP-binding protein